MQNFPQPPVNPIEYPLCRWCDGAGEVPVHTIMDVNGEPQEIDSRAGDCYIRCQRCDGQGCEPAPNEYDNPNIS